MSIVRGVGLWDDIEPYVRDLMDDDPGNADFGATPPDVAAPQTARTVPRHLVQRRRDIPGFGDPDWTGWGREEVSAGSDAFAPDIAEAVREDVEHIKERYIVGKVVGRDLADETGRRIASQGQRITRRMIRQAEESGRLVELIEHMTFDLLED